ncbi:MAG TPA: ABC-2 family transporter protein [Fimbriimonadaceae bacterium]|nr:ABC-2 family transporter protein [Fimbriimonadaceae bacterium]HRJ96654.1 ABC-2 family transporter protein [Fimbriimonadaceae bacterium]
MGRYWRIYRTFFVSSLARELEFRANFFAKIAQNVVWIGFFLLIVLVIYRNTDSVAGWNRGDAFVLAATCFVMNAIVSALFMSLQEIPEQVRRGTLDFVITKPVDTQFWVSTRKFNFDQIGTLFAGIAMVWIGVSTSGVHPGAAQWFAYVVLLLAATLLFYAFNMALMTLGIWLVRVDNLWVLGETVMQVARYPLDIYSTGLQRMFTYFVPLAFLATVPSSQLVKGYNAGMLGLGVAWSLAALLFSRWFWNFALRHYSSASS